MIVTRTLSFQTSGRCHTIDITRQVAGEVADSGMADGTVTLFVPGSTAALTTIENEGGVVQDFADMWERLVPAGVSYAHDRAWGDGNGYSHVRAAMLGASLTVPFVDKVLTLGTWQQIVLVDFDNRGRSRRLVLQIIGE
jgi:secondary thiamine-phosphate synthase enzyme